MLTFLVFIIAFVVVMDSKFVDDMTQVLVPLIVWTVKGMFKLAKKLLPLLGWLVGAGVTMLFYNESPIWGVFVGIVVGLMAIYSFCGFVRKTYQRRKFNRENDVPAPFKGLRVKSVH